MKTSKKCLSAVIFAVILASMAACGKEAASSGTTKTTEEAGDHAAVTETGTEIETEEIPVFTEKDYGGKDFTMYLWSESQIAVEEETGDIIPDANFRRNRTVEELFNLKFRYEVGVGSGDPYSGWIRKIQSSIQAGDDAYQLVGGYAYVLAPDTLGNGFLNLHETDIDFSQPWWPSNIVEASDIGGSIYLVYGNIDTTNFNGLNMALYFNKKLMQEYELENFYDLVNSGKWTLDKLIECAKSVTTDLDGNSVMDENDRYGYMTEPFLCIDAYIQACDVQITKNDADSLPQILGLTDKYVAVQEKVRDFVRDNSISFYDLNHPTYLNIFRNGNGLIISGCIADAFGLRDMEDEIGIIPYPKWDEAQEQYYTHNGVTNTTGFCVPETADAELSGAVIDALSYYGYRDVLPEYYERALKGKATRDNESEAMLDIIFNNVVLDFTEVYSYCFGDQKSPSMLLRLSIYQNKDIASMYEKQTKIFDKTMSGLFEKLGVE